MAKLFLCGDVMTGRGIDQILAVPGDPTLDEPWVKDARDYVALAERANGPIPRGADPAYVWGEALAILDEERPDARIVNLETAMTTSDERAPKGINYRMHPANAGCLAAARIDWAAAIQICEDALAIVPDHDGARITVDAAETRQFLRNQVTAGGELQLHARRHLQRH